MLKDSIYEVPMQTHQLCLFTLAVPFGTMPPGSTGSLDWGYLFASAILSYIN